MKGGNGRRCGGRGGGVWDTLAAYSGGGMTGQTRWRHPRGGGTNSLAASPEGGGWDKHPGATPLPHRDEECESCRGKGGGRLGTTIKGKQVGGIAKRCEKR